jgi:choline kinase
MIILAAGQGTRLQPLTDDRPKCLVELAGRPLLDWQLRAARAEGISDVVVIGGYRADQLASYDVRNVTNPNFASTNMVRTLFCARELFGDGFVMSYGDIAYSPAVLRSLLQAEGQIGVVVDKTWLPYWKRRFDDPLSDAESLAIDPQGFLSDIGQKADRIDEIVAQYIGLVKFDGLGVQRLAEAYAAAEADTAGGHHPFGGTRSLDRLYMTDLLRGMIKRGDKLAAVETLGGWVEIDTPRDLAVAEDLVAGGRLGHFADD